MADTSNKKLNFVMREIATAQQLIEVLNNWRDLRREWDNAAYAGTITDDDLTADSVKHVAAADLGAAFYTLELIETALGSGALTNLYRLTP